MRNRLLDLKTRFRAEAGPVKYEIEQSAQVLKGLLDELVRRRNVWLTRLSDLGSASTYYTDMVIARTDSISFGDTNWVA
jgi:CelD/BcsL family acetyltransferase involved in cellulose biosynthesis